MNLESDGWAQDVFGDCDLKDVRRTRRLVRVAQGVLQNPAGRISAVFDSPAELAGAYDLIENDRVAPAKLASSLTRFALRRAQQLHCPFVWVPTDGTSVTVTDRTRSKGTGRLSNSSFSARGDKVHDALLLEPSGIPLGLAAMACWQRPEELAKKNHARRDTRDKETQRWLDVRAAIRNTVRAEDPSMVLHFLHDREADAWPILLDVVEHQEREFSTIRAQWDRRLLHDDGTSDEQTHRLREALANSPIHGEIELELPAAPNRTPRDALLTVRSCRVTLDLRDRKHGEHRAAPLWAVCVQEKKPRSGEKPLEWLLLTTYAVEDFESCEHVVSGYTYRWRIEEFHQTWKSAGTDVESTQLRAADHRARWYLLLAGASAELLRWKLVSRTTPTLAANAVFTEEQLEAVRDMQADEVVPEDESATVWQVWVALAYLGGWPGSKTRPPGVQIVLRGWLKVCNYMIGMRRRRARKTQAITGN
ncbi:MAG: IS4 family transposase [Polyangiales bacterium]